MQKYINQYKKTNEKTQKRTIKSIETKKTNKHK